MKENKNGFTLVELLVSMAIIVSLMVMMIGTINPRGLIGKARDSIRKNDLKKMKVAFEEYYNDKGSYPYEEMNFCKLKQNCGKLIAGMNGYLKKCLCDPNGDPYVLVTDLGWFKVITNLENKEDKDIPKDWYTDNRYSSLNLDKNSVNYGVSSSNILWYEKVLGSGCNWNKCYSTMSCNLPGSGCNEANSSDGFCFLYNELTKNCNDFECRVSCCGGGCN